MKTKSISKQEIGLVKIFRLGLFNLGLGVMAVLTLAVLNRVMISELGIPGTVTAGTLAMSQIVAPARVWFGQLSDVKPIAGLHRTNYVRIGTVLFGLAVFLAVQIVWQMGQVIRDSGGWSWNNQTITLAILLGLVLACYGLAVSSSSTPFTALLVDVSPEKNRSQVVAIAWSMLMVGIVIGGISGSILLKSVQQSDLILGINIGSILAVDLAVIPTPLNVLQTSINKIFIFVPLIVFALACIATWGIEKRYSRRVKRSQATEREDSITISSAFKVLTTSRQTGIFFSFLIILTIGLFMQEAILEPYGGEVFGMSIAQTTLLNSFWGIGILIGYGVTGFLVIPRLGKINTARIGCVLVAICFILIILSGLTQEQTILKATMIIFGMATGITTISGISLMLDLTSLEKAGTYIGAWGLAQALARAVATFSGGIVLDIGKQLSSSLVVAYGLVFGLQAVAMLLAILMLNQVNVEEWKRQTQGAIIVAMEGDLDG